MVPHSKAQTIDLPENIYGITLVKDIKTLLSFSLVDFEGNKLEHFPGRLFI
jgi:hypothetical protein